MIRKSDYSEFKNKKNVIYVFQSQHLLFEILEANSARTVEQDEVVNKFPIFSLLDD